MNDPDLEKNLRYLLRPAEPTSDLRRRIQEELDADQAPSRRQADELPRAATPGWLEQLLRGFGWACAGAAAVLTILIVLPSRHRSTPTAERSSTTAEVASEVVATQPAAFEHDETTHELVSAENSDQLVETDDGPARAVRYSYVERHAWSNPQTGASVVLEVPREDVYLLPVSLE
jgi:hypothetical protein